MTSVMANVSSAVRKGGFHSKVHSGTSLFSFLKRKDANGKKKTNPVKLQQERVRQFSIWFEEREKDRDHEYLRRRRKRDINREEISKATGRYRLLFIPTCILLFTGIIILITSIIPGIGSDTIFWKKREIFHIIGPTVFGCGIIMLMVTEALLNRRKKHMTRIRRIEDMECTKRKLAISQKPCVHQQRLLDTYFKSGKLCGCRFDLVAQKRKPMVSVETQTDEILLNDSIQKTHGRGSFRKYKQKLCKMESVDSAAYSMESSATCFTDLYDGDEDEDVNSINEEEVCPLIFENNRPLSGMGFVPVVPTVKYDTKGRVCNDIPFIITPPTTMQDQHQPNLKPLKSFENMASDQSLSLSCEPYRDRANSEGHVNRSFERSISVNDGYSYPEASSSSLQLNEQVEQQVLVTNLLSLNNSVPNLNTTTATSPLLCVDPNVAARRASWTTFQ